MAKQDFFFTHLISRTVAVVLPLKIISERHTEMGLKNKLEAEVSHDVATGGKKMLRSWIF